jgi:hypothetical protein
VKILVALHLLFTVYEWIFLLVYGIYKCVFLYGDPRSRRSSRKFNFFLVNAELVRHSQPRNVLGHTVACLPKKKSFGRNTVEAFISHRISYFLGWYSGGWSPIGSTRHCGQWPVVPDPGDYDDLEIGGMMIGKGNRSTRRKPAPVPFVHHKPHMLPGREPGPPRWETSD